MKRKQEYLALLLFVTCFRLGSSTQCGLRFTRQKRDTSHESEPQAGEIVGGSVARQGDFPWIVSIYIGGNPLCGGSIIHNQWVLSAAHCFVNKEGLSKTVKIGSLYHAKGKEHKVRKIITHPQFIASSYFCDVALLEMEDPFNYNRGEEGKGAVGPICLPDPEVDYQGTATVAGWGARTSEEGTPQQQLMAVDVKILNKQPCETYPIFNETVSICVGYIEGGKDACQGDSGGPLQAIVGGLVYQIGIVSYGDGCGAAYKPGVYTRVQTFVSWIKQYVKTQ